MNLAQSVVIWFGFFFIIVLKFLCNLTGHDKGLTDFGDEHNGVDTGDDVIQGVDI